MSNEWEKKWNDGVRPCAWDEVADFITAIVSTREKEIAEEVKKKRKEPTHSGTGSISWYNQALDEVLLIMKK